MRKRKLVNAFATEMEKRMASKEKKYKKIPWWQNRGLFIELEDYVEKLNIALDYGDSESIKKECADLANLAMMIAGQNDPKWRQFRND